MTLINLFGPSGIGKTTLLYFLDNNNIRAIDTDWLSYRTKDDKWVTPYGGIARSFKGIDVILLGVASNWAEFESSVEHAKDTGIGLQSSVFNYCLWKPIEDIAHQGFVRDAARPVERRKSLKEYALGAINFYKSAIKAALPIIHIQWIETMVEESYDLFYELTGNISSLGIDNISKQLEAAEVKLYEG